MDAFLGAVTTVGFPISLTVWLLVRFDKRISELVDAINGRDGLLVKLESTIKNQEDIIKRQDESIEYLRGQRG